MQTEYKGYYLTILNPANKDQLIEFLQYHTVPDVNIRSYGRDEDVYSFTTSLNETLTMTLENDMFTVNDANDSQNLPSRVIDGNIFASNGVMHQIDRVLIPPQYRNPSIPVTPAPVTPAPTTTAAPVNTPAPVTSAPVTPAPVTPAPPTVAAPTIAAPSPITPAPVEEISTTPAPIESNSSDAISTPAPIESNSRDDESPSAPSISPTARQTAQPSLFNPQGPPPAPTTSGGTRTATTFYNMMSMMGFTIMMILPLVLLF
mmetsp:Transcript_1910/g.2794  ORF Transcript_1910/g.2794 Transcript_1910/m.2794 type:complete len:260 (-) Transcript_1910:280-1059(-)